MEKKSNCQKTYFYSLLRVIALLVVALLLPRFYFTETKIYPSLLSSEKRISIKNNFKLGLENISQDFLKQLGNGRLDYTVGIITNHTGIDQEGKRNIDILLTKGLNIKQIFIPEDDFSAYKKGLDWDMVDHSTQIPLCVLSSIDSLKKMKEYAFGNIDVIFLDIQDKGISPDSYLTTLLKTLQSAASQSKTVVVLDRPNLLGSTMEGIISDARDGENIPIPLRHGMTIGELASYFNSYVVSQSARLYVVPMKQYTRSLFSNTMPAYHTSLLTNIDMYYGSSFLSVLGSVSPFDIGFDTDMAFNCLTLPESLHVPKQKWFELRALLKNQGMETSWVRYYNSKKRMYYAGLRFLIPNVEHFSTFNAIVTIITYFQQAGIKLTFSSEFERTFGGRKIKDFLDGKYTRYALEYDVNKGLKNFFNKAYKSFIYKPTPKIVLL